MRLSKSKRVGFMYSGAMHAVLLLILIFGLPSFLNPKPDPTPTVISVDIVPIGPITNVPIAETPKKEEEKKEEKPPEKPKPEVKKEEPKPEEKKEPVKPQPKVKQEEPKPEPTPERVKKDEKKKEEPKPKEDPKPKEEKKKPKEEDLDAVLKSVKDTAQKSEPKESTEKSESSNSKSKSNSKNYNPELPLSMTEVDAIRSQFTKCWNMPAGARDAHTLVVTILIELQQDGTVTQAQFVGDKVRYASDTFFRAAAESAIRAVWQCSPLKNLPPEKYETWRSLELTFDPKDMLF